MSIEDFRGEYSRYRSLAERAMAQVSEEAMNRVPMEDGNSMAMIVRHVGGNLVSRFTDFLSSDGEKPTRDRDAEFVEREYARAEIDRWWHDGWAVLETQLASLGDDDLGRTVTIRQQPLTVHAALSRSLSHVSYHVGQLVLLARLHAGDGGAAWRSLSIPRGESSAYNQAPTREKGPSR